MTPVPILEEHFWHDGRGPELQRVIWGFRNALLRGFEYYNPDASYDRANLRHLRLESVEAYSMAGEEVHGNISVVGESKAAVWRIENSIWLPTLQQRHLAGCDHYQIMFYDEIFDVVCKNIIPGKGGFPEDDA